MFQQQHETTQNTFEKPKTRNKKMRNQQQTERREKFVYANSKANMRAPNNKPRERKKFI